MREREREERGGGWEKEYYERECHIIFVVRGEEEEEREREREGGIERYDQTYLYGSLLQWEVERRGSPSS